jgi:hypothetical protein
MMYELRPDLFPQPWLTDAELLLWGWHFEEANRR